MKLKEQPRIHSILTRSLLVLLSVTLTLILLEGFLRVFFAVRHNDIRRYQPSFVHSGVSQFDRARFTSHPFLPYAPRGFDHRNLFVYRQEINKTLEYDVANNSLGFRTPERGFEKPADVKRILTLGGSTTVDGPTNSQTWPAILENKLNEYYANSGFHIQVINLGVDMANSPTSLIDLEFIGVEYHPDLVISYDGVNDVHTFGYSGLMPDYRTIMQKYDENQTSIQSRLPKRSFGSYLVTVVSYKLDQLFHNRMDLYSQVFSAKESKLVPADNPLAGIEYYERNLRLMRAVSSEYQARFVAATAHWTTPEPKVDLMNSELRKFFAAQNIDYLDLDSLLPHNDWSIHVDAVHWTEKGLEMTAEMWKRKITSADLLGCNSQK